MSRVAQLDSSALDEEVHSLFWSDFAQNVNPQSNREEWQLLLETLVFYFGSKSLSTGPQTTTYGSQLSGVGYMCRRRTLFLITILSKYLKNRISHFLFTSKYAANLIELYKYPINLYSALDLLNLFHFLLSTSSTSLKYLSPLHRLLGASSSTDSLSPVNFYHNTVYAGIEYQNRQLLWNAILELFNVTLMNNTRWLNKTPPTSTAPTVPSTKVVHCARCTEFPTNPYKFSCCRSIYCYTCAAKALDSVQCDRCHSTKNLQATPIY